MRAVPSICESNSFSCRICTLDATPAGRITAEVLFAEESLGEFMKVTLEVRVRLADLGWAYPSGLLIPLIDMEMA